MNASASNERPSSIYLLCYHQRRLSEAVAAVTSAGHAGDWLAEVPDADALERIVLRGLDSENLNRGLATTTARRVKVCLYQDGKVTVECPEAPSGQPLLFPIAFTSVKEPLWSVVVDYQPTNPRMSTGFKTSDRVDYDRARASGATATQEVLLYSTTGEVMDASITTPYFFRGGQWMTPHASSGGQLGATRQWALDRMLCMEQVVLVESLCDGETIWLSNALRGFFPARLGLHG